MARLIERCYVYIVSNTGNIEKGVRTTGILKQNIYRRNIPQSLAAKTEVVASNMHDSPIATTRHACPASPARLAERQFTLQKFLPIEPESAPSINKALA